jgi:hypothetical protein
MSILEIGCCGAYCRTCPVLKEKFCRGCKLGYKDGKRDLAKAKCKMKVCCMTRGYNTCADCKQYDSCDILQDFHGKNGYKYKKYKQATDFIRAHGYARFLKIANKWKIQYGKYE